MLGLGTNIGRILQQAITFVKDFWQTQTNDWESQNTKWDNT